MVLTKDTLTLKSVFRKYSRISELVSKVNSTYLNEFFFLAFKEKWKGVPIPILVLRSTLPLAYNRMRCKSAWVVIVVNVG